MNVKINWDAVGITTSVACAIHCALLPLLLTSLPIFGVEILNNNLFECFMIFTAFVIGVASLYHGWKKHHHRASPILIFTAGISFLFAKQIWHQWHLYFLVPAVLLIVSAHYFNFRFCKQANHCHDTDCSH